MTSAERIDCVCLSQREPALSAVQKKKKICGIWGRDLSGSVLGSLAPVVSRPSSPSPIRPTRFHRTLSPCGSSPMRTQTNWSLCTESRIVFETVFPRIVSDACCSVRPGAVADFVGKLSF